MTRGRIARLLVATCFLFAVLATTAGAAPTTMKFPVTENFTSCTGDDVTLTGEQTIVSDIRTDGAGGLHDMLHIENRGLKGVGLPSGAKYVGLDTTEDHDVILQNTTNATFVHNLDLIRQAEDGTLLVGDDLHVKQLFHVTINAMGVPSFKDEYQADCT